MEAVVAGVAQDKAKDLVTLAIDQLKYACCFNKFVKELEEERGNLIARRNGVQKRVKQAKEQTKEPAEVMEKWLKDANNDIDEADELLKKAKTKKSCLPYCPNWFCRWYLGRELEHKKGDVEKRTKEGDPYVPLERITTLPSDIALDCGKSIHFESRQSVEEQFMKAVKDEKVSLIGLYGMGGCGKTTLAAQVGNKAKEENLFDKVLFVPVSSVVEIRRIQDKIASSLSYEFPPAEIEVSERAKRLHMRLSPQENKILVILDDVWQKLNFGAIGIPYSVEDPKSCCKVLITTRSEDVCKAMDCHKNIHLPILTDDEAWSLFKSQANISEVDTLKDLARKVSDKCKGLPVAISAVASTLKGKEEVAWKAALTRLTSSVPLNIEKGLQDPYKCLQLSYDNLDSPEAKSLLLLCSVFPEDDEIPVEYLTRFAIGLGMVGEVRTYEGARYEVTAAKNKLISSCLLLDVDNGKGVKMHDLVRDVAQWIGKNENKAILCISKNDVTLEENNSIRFLWCDEFPNELDPSNLEFLWMNTGLEVSDEVFKRMGKLRVLVLLNSKKTRPLSTTSFRSLTNLRCLLLEDWELSDFSFLGGMQKLEGLSMFDCSLRELPDDVEVTQHKKLKLFDLSGCSMERNNFEVIGRLPELEELYILDERSEWDVCSGSSAEFFNKFSVPQKLQRHVIQLGTLFEDLFEDEILFTNCKALCLSCFHTSNMAIKGLAKKSNALAIANIQGRPNSIIPDIFQIEENGMNHLIKFWIHDSDEMKYLIDTSNHLSEVATLFPKLVKLRIKSMKHLESLWHGHLPPNGDFHKLESLYVSDCPELTSLFTPSFLQLESNQSQYLLEITPITPTPFVNLNSGSFNLSSLTSLTIESCPKLAALFSASVAQTLTSLEKLIIKDCQSLQTLYIGGCESLQYEFPISFVRCLVKLKHITIKDTPNLKYIFGQSDMEDSPSHEHTKFDQLELPVLEELELNHIPKMVGIFPGNCSVICPSLLKLSLGIGKYVNFSTTNCSTVASEVGHQDYITIKVSNLESLHPVQSAQCLPKQLQGLNILVMRNIREIELKGIDKVNHLFTLSNSSSMMLQVLRIEACPGLKHIIDIRDADCGKKNLECDVFPNLKELSVQYCGQLEYMFGQQPLDHQSYKEIHINFLALEKLSLNSLANFITICPTSSLSITWPSLKMFNVNGCSQFINSSISNLMVSSDSRELASTTNRSNENTGKENVHEDAISEEARDEKMLPQDSQVVVPHPESTTSHSDPSESQSRSYPLECDPVPENSSQLQMNHRDPATSKCVMSSSHTNQSTSGNLAETIHEQNQIESHKILESERESNHKNTTEYRRPVRRRLWYWIWLLLAFFSVLGLLLFLFQHNHHQDPLQYPSLNLVDQESIRERSFLDKQFVPEETINIENREEESIQEGPTFEKDSLEGLSLGGIAPNHNEFNGGEILAQDSQIVEEDNKPNEEGGIGVISNDSNEIHQGSDRSQSLIIAKLGECKHFVDMDDAQIALLAEAISAYPHLWNLCEKFNGRFQAWMLKTLADMLLFLRNESVISVTPQRLKDFHRLCDEVAQFGFERSWIDEMRQRVMDKDPEVDSTQAQISELLQRHEQLTRELVEIKGKLNRLNDFVAARKKCFDFL